MTSHEKIGVTTRRGTSRAEHANRACHSVPKRRAEEKRWPDRALASTKTFLRVPSRRIALYGNNFLARDLSISAKDRKRVSLFRFRFRVCGTTVLLSVCEIAIATRAKEVLRFMEANLFSSITQNNMIGILFTSKISLSRLAFEETLKPEDFNLLSSR